MTGGLWGVLVAWDELGASEARLRDALLAELSEVPGVGISDFGSEVAGLGAPVSAAEFRLGAPEEQIQAAWEKGRRAGGEDVAEQAELAADMEALFYQAIEAVKEREATCAELAGLIRDRDDSLRAALAELDRTKTAASERDDTKLAKVEEKLAEAIRAKKAVEMRLSRLQDSMAAAPPLEPRAAALERDLAKVQTDLAAYVKRENLLLGRIQELEEADGSAADCAACEESRRNVEKFREALGFYGRGNVWGGTARGPLMLERTDWQTGSNGMPRGGKVARKALGLPIGEAAEDVRPRLSQEERLAKVMAALDGRDADGQMLPSGLPSSAPAGLPPGLELRGAKSKPRRGKPIENWPWQR